MRFKMNIEGNTESVLKEEDAKYVFFKYFYTKKFDVSCIPLI